MKVALLAVGVMVLAPCQPTASVQKDSAPIRGVLIDDRTAEPIPSFTIDLRFSAHEIERVVTDDQGRFESEPHGRRRLSLDLVDDDRSPRPARRGRVRTAHDPSSAEAEARELRIEIGPTFFLELIDATGEIIEPKAAGRFHAELFHDPPLTDGVLLRTDRGEWKTEPAPRAPLRAGDQGLWTRFRDLEAERRFAGGPWWLEIRDEEGFLAGGARVEHVHGVQSEELRIQLTPRAVFEFACEPGSGTLKSLGNDHFQPVRGAPVRWLHSGAYDFLSVQYGLTQSIPELSAGTVFELRAEAFEELGPRATASIFCRATERTASALEEGFQLWMQPVDFPHEPPFVRVARSEVRFDELPQDNFTLTCRGDVAWDGLSVAGTISPTLDAAAAEVSLDIDTTAGDFVVLCVDAEEGSPVPDAEFCWQHGNYAEWWSAREEGRVLLRDLLMGDWAIQGARATLRAPGYIDREIDLAELVRGGEMRALRVSMERGWSTVLIAYDRRSRNPLEGVTALLDGVQQGTSDAEGRIALRADTLPERLDIELEGYRWVDGDIEWLRHELLAQDAFEPRVWLAPNDY